VKKLCPYLYSKFVFKRRWRNNNGIVSFILVLLILYF
jgi:hypothetical protein